MVGFLGYGKRRRGRAYSLNEGGAGFVRTWVCIVGGSLVSSGDFNGKRLCNVDDGRSLGSLGMNGEVVQPVCAQWM